MQASTRITHRPTALQRGRGERVKIDKNSTDSVTVDMNSNE